MAVRCVIFFCIWIFWHFMLQAKGYGTWWQIFVKFKCGKVSFFLRRFGSRILHILCAFAALLAVLFDGHPPWPNDFHEPTNINKLHSTSKKLRNIVLLYGSSYIPCQLEKSHVFFLPLFFLGGFLFRSSGFGHEIDHVGPLLWRFLRSRHLWRVGAKILGSRTFSWKTGESETPGCGRC